jgi:hypothetical protein
VSARDDPPPGEPREPDPPGPTFPDPRPFRRIQLVTVALIAAAALITLTSDSRPGAVRWGTIAGVAVLAVAVWLITRRRRSDA